MEFIHKVIYVNLDKRKDRREEIEEELRRMNISAERFPAKERNPGCLGCSASHLTILKRARWERWPNVLVLEDDFVFRVDKPTLDHALRTFFTSGIEYDVLMLSYNMIESEPLNETVSYGRNVQTTAGYIVNQRFYDTLIDTWELGMFKLKISGQHWLYAADQCWKPLQTKHSFLCFNKAIGAQRISESDTGCALEENQ